MYIVLVLSRQPTGVSTVWCRRCGVDGVNNMSNPALSSNWNLGFVQTNVYLLGMSCSRGRSKLAMA